MHIVYIFICIIFGFLVGFALAFYSKISAHEPVGSLVIDKSDPDDGPYMFLELKVGPAYVEAQDKITLQVVRKNYISQK